MTVLSALGVLMKNGLFNLNEAKIIKRITEGVKNAKITIIDYESLTANQCANFHTDVYPELKKNFIDNGLVRIEFRHFPLDIIAFHASKIALCNNNGLVILNSLYVNQQKWAKGSSVVEATENLKKFLVSEGYNVDFEKCINDKEIEYFVLNDRIEGEKNFKVQAVPTIIINNKKFEKTLNYKNLKKALEKLI